MDMNLSVLHSPSRVSRATSHPGSPPGTSERRRSPPGSSDCLGCRSTSSCRAAAEQSSGDAGPA